MAGEQGAVLGDFKDSGDLKDFPTHGQQMLPSDYSLHPIKLNQFCFPQKFCLLDLEP